MKFIRNFCIIAHIDHGKSTLADRLLERTGTISDKEKKNQFLDDMDLERERGITIKSHAIQMNYKYKGIDYILNLIDTPGHVDFSSEVSRSITACEGALLIVDAVQGVQAQTISNFYLALENNLKIIPILNKIDLPGSNPERVVVDIVNLIGCLPEEIIYASAKKNIGIDKILNTIIEKIPHPHGDPISPLQALIFDSIYNSFRGVEAYFRVLNGEIRKGQKIKFMGTEKICSVDEIGIFKSKKIPMESIGPGNVGYLIPGIKNVLEIKVGDTFTSIDNPATNPIKGFKEVKPMVFAGVYPVDSKDYEELRTSIEKLRLNDVSLTFITESSIALGLGFRCGFLGMLHMEIIRDRLHREYNIAVITTVPNVAYKAFLKKSTKKFLWVNNPSDMPPSSFLERIEEPYIRASIITLCEYLGSIMSLCIKKRGIIKNQSYITPSKVELLLEIPLAEVVFDFYDKLKSLSKGYASFDYTPIEYRTSDLVRIDVLINTKTIDAFSAIVPRSNAFYIGKKMCEKLYKLIPRQQFEIPIQIAIGRKIIASETIKAFRKDVIAKCYGGDISRKKKLIEKQKKGKKKMRQIGKIEIPQLAFMTMLKLED
ncbi:translation elongation factor 4 [Candidatus Walczuchella monophlebidarum]|uniref:Elongation factor 4 n=1 Tax=Candidatus Walczuchella monophlebidarum TaxID=1415657 RepID=A0A068DWX2_9FLAO|nr:translation elongation factor 4 [Candidatus Walczuchella monophlebidarum]AID37528.1 GTP-binding protein LepA [Candidatus Walczuchella monophlebidarum]